MYIYNMNNNLYVYAPLLHSFQTMVLPQDTFYLRWNPAGESGLILSHEKMNQILVVFQGLTKRKHRR
jgi:hypothetical protein